MKFNFLRRLIEDIRADCRRKLEVRKALEKSWDVSVREKQEKQLDELAYTKKPSLLVQQQCDKYVRYVVSMTCCLPTVYAGIMTFEQ